MVRLGRSGCPLGERSSVPGSRKFDCVVAWQLLCDTSRRRVGSPFVLVADLRHFLDPPESTPGPARRLAEQLCCIVRAATVRSADQSWVSALSCSRRPGRVACVGHIELRRTDRPSSISWRCTTCGDDGVVAGWEGSAFDLRHDDPDDEPHLMRVRLPVVPDVVATLRDVLFVDEAAERIIFGAYIDRDSVVLEGDVDEFEDLLDSIAAEANHDDNRRRQRRWDAAFAALSEAVAAV